MWPALLCYVRNHAKCFDLAESERSIRAILLARQPFRQPGRQRLTWLLFSEDATAPFAVARHYASPIYNFLVEREYQVCRELWEKFSEPIVPPPISLATIENYTVFFEKAFPGSSLTAEIAHRSRLDPSGKSILGQMELHFQIVGDFIRRMNSKAEKASSEDLQTELFQICQEYQSSLGTELVEGLSVEGALKLFMDFFKEIPTMKRIVNFDLVPSNILRTNEKVVIVDWEYSQQSVLWPFEALKFTYWYLVELERYGLLKEGNMGQWFTKYLEGQAGEKGRLVDSFLKGLGLPVGEARLRYGLWLFYTIIERNLVASVSADSFWAKNIMKKELQGMSPHSNRKCSQEVPTTIKDSVRPNLSAFDVLFQPQLKNLRGIHKFIRKLLKRLTPLCFRRWLSSKYEALWRWLFFFRKFSILKQQLEIILNQNCNAQEVVIFLPSVEWNLPLFQRPHQMAMALARNGCLVFFCEPPHSTDYPDGFYQLKDRLYLAKVPLKIFKNICSPIVFVLPYNKHYLDLFNDPIVVYEVIDELEVFGGDFKRLQRNHEELLRVASVVVATAERLKQRIQKDRPDVILCPNGVDYDFIQQTIRTTVKPPEDIVEIVEKGRPIIGYYGALAEWFDYDLLRETALQRPNYEFLLIGPDYDGSIRRSGIQQVSNIRWLGPRRYAELPQYLKYFDVAIIPFKLNKITHSTSPLKLFEYMAGGKPVVTTAMYECQRYRGVLIAHNAREFAQKLDEAMLLRNNSEYLRIIDQVAQENTWDTRASQLLRALAPFRKSCP